MTACERGTRRFLNSFFGIVLCAVSTFVFFIPYEWRIIPQVETIASVTRWICFGLLIIFFFLLYMGTFDVIRDNLALLFGLLFIAVLLYSTKMNGSDWNAAMSTEGFFGIMCLLNAAVFLRVNPKKYLLIMFFIYFAIAMINIYTVYHYWNIWMWGEYQQYREQFFTLVGNYNLGILYGVPMAICGLTYGRCYHWWLQIINYPAMAACLIMSVKCQSVTQEVVYGLILIVMILSDLMRAWKGLYKFLRIFNAGFMMLLNIAAFVFCVAISNTEWMEKIGIDPDFHERRYIWNITKELITQKPIWGYGTENVYTFASKFPDYNPSHAHCTYLQVIYDTGLVGSICFVLLLLVTVIAVYRAKTPELRFLMSMLLFAAFLAALMETYTFVYILLVIGLVYYISRNVGWPRNAEPVKKRRK